MTKQLEEWTKQGIVEHRSFSTNFTKIVKGALFCCKPYFQCLSKSLNGDLTLGKAMITRNDDSYSTAIVLKGKKILISVNGVAALANQTKSSKMHEQKCSKGYTKIVIQSHLMIYGGMRTTE